MKFRKLNCEIQLSECIKMCRFMTISCKQLILLCRLYLSTCLFFLLFVELSLLSALHFFAKTSSFSFQILGCMFVMSSVLSCEILYRIVALLTLWHMSSDRYSKVPWEILAQLFAFKSPKDLQTDTLLFSGMVCNLTLYYLTSHLQ